MSNFVYFDVLIRGTLMMEKLTHDETRIGHNRLKLVGNNNFMDG